MGGSNEFMQRRTRRKMRRMRIRKIRRFILFTALIAGLSLCAILVSYHFMTNELSSNTDTDEKEDVIATVEQAPVSAQSGIPDASVASSNNLLDIIMEGGGSHTAYLTFDDGPTDNITPQILDILSRYGIHATFFEVGKMIEKNPEITQRVINEGHLVAGHSFSHDYDALYQSEESFVDEITRTYDIISRYYPKNTIPMKLIRFPGGGYNAGDHATEKQLYKETLKSMGYYYADWNSLNGDAEGAKKDADQLFDYFVNSISTNNIVVLMHDASTKQSTVDALPRIIEYLQANGWDFKTLAEIPYNPVQENSAQ